MKWANAFERSKLTRRAILRGAGVCLALPWLEALSLKPARGADMAPLRFLPIFFPNGAAANFWPPGGVGVDDAWTLSPILEPLAGLKSKTVVLSNLENYTAMQKDQGVEPSHARCAGAFLTCVDSDGVRSSLKTEPANGVSIDQLLAQSLTRETTFASLQLGLSTTESFCDGRHCSLSRSISWKSATEPLYKEVNPQAVFDSLVASLSPDGAKDATASVAADQRRALDQSVLDAVLENADRTRKRLGTEDKQRLDQFLDSVREVEKQVSAMPSMKPTTMLSCGAADRPGGAAKYGLSNGQDGYSRANHAAAMNQLIVMALRCDATRIVSYMLDDARSDFVYDHLENRKFSATSSEADKGKVGGYHGLQHAGDSNNGYATINRWLTQQTFDLCKMLDEVKEGDRSLLDNSVVLFGSSMHGSNHDANELPIVLIGSGGGRLRTNQHIKFSSTPDDRPLRDLYFTLANEVYGANIKSFGVSTKGAEHRLISELLKG